MKCLCAGTRRAARVLTREYEVHLRECGLTAAQFELLAEVQGCGTVSQVELAEALAVDQTTLSRGLRLLVAREWVERAEDGVDRRVVRYGLTAAGVEGLREAMPRWKAAQEAVRGRLGAGWEAAWGIVERLGVSVPSSS